MDFKYLISYSLDDGEISNAVGCYTFNQSKEIGAMIFESYKAMGCKVDYLEIQDTNGNVLLSMVSKNKLN